MQTSSVCHTKNNILANYCNHYGIVLWISSTQQSLVMLDEKGKTNL